MRILIYTGKGGVGKTSIAAATALYLSRRDKNVLVMSTDQAHSLSDSFEVSLSSSPLEIRDQLWALEIDPVAESRKAWGNLRDYLKQIISQKANGGLEADEVLLFPGLDELFSLLKILDAVESNTYDVIVVDCAPTGETLSLLRYPERLSLLADKLLPSVRNFTSAFGGLISRKTTVPKPRDEVFAEFDHLVKRLSRLREILTDRSICSMRIVLTPERIVYEEARKNYSWIRAFDYGVDAVYLNKIYPEEALEGYFERWSGLQEEMILKTRESFGECRIFALMLQKEEVRGLTMLTEVGEALYSSADPSEVFSEDYAYTIEDEESTRYLILDIPYVGEEDIRITKEGQNLYLTMKNEMRCFSLPDNISRRRLSGWNYKDGKLRMIFDYE